MSQMSFGDSEHASKRKRTRRETFLAEMEQIIPRTILLNLIEPVYQKAGNGPPPYPLKAMLKAAHWSIRMMSAQTGVSAFAVQRISI